MFRYRSRVGNNIVGGGGEVVKADWVGQDDFIPATVTVGQKQASVLKVEPAPGSGGSGLPLLGSSAIAASRTFLWDDNNGANPIPAVPAAYEHRVALTAPMTAQVTDANGPTDATAIIEVKSSTLTQGPVVSHLYNKMASYNYYTGQVFNSGNPAPSVAIFPFSAASATLIPNGDGTLTFGFSVIQGLDLSNAAYANSNYSVRDDFIYRNGNANASAGQSIATSIGLEIAAPAN